MDSLVDFSDLGSGAPPTEDEAQGALNLASQGAAKVTSGLRTPEHNAAVHGVPNSLHLSGQAADFVLPPGTDPHAVRAELESQGYPVTEWLIEKAGDAHSTGPHVHWGWGPKGQQAATAPANGSLVDFSDLGGPKPTQNGSLVDFSDLAPQKPDRPEASWAAVLSPNFASAWDRIKRGVLGMVQSAANAGPPQPNIPTAPGEEFESPVMQHARTAARAAVNPWLTRVQSDIADDLKANTPATDPLSAKDVIYKVLAGVTDMVPALAAGMLTRNPAEGATAGALIIGTQSGGSTYAESMDRGRSPQQAALDAGFSAMVNSTMAVLPLHVFFKPGQAFLGKTLRSAGAFGLQSIATEALQIGYDKGLVTPDMTLAQAWERLESAGIIGTLEGALLGGGHAGLEAAVSRWHHTKPAATERKEPGPSEPPGPSGTAPPGPSAPQPKPARPDLLEMAAIPKPGRKEPTAGTPAQERPAEPSQRPAEAATGHPAPEAPKEQPAEEPPEAPIVERLRAEHEAWRTQVDRSEPVMEAVLPRKRVNWHGVPTGDLNIVRDPQTGLFGLRHGAFVGDGGGATPYSFQYASPQQALDAAKEAFLDRANHALNDRRTSVSAKREANALKNWAEKLALPTPPPEGPPDQGPPGQVYTPEVQPGAPKQAPVQGDLFTETGKSTEGRTLYEDKNGVRSYVENGVRITEPVQLRPTRGGMEMAVDRGAHPEFATPEEAQALPPSLPAPVAEPAPPSHPRAIELAGALATRLKANTEPVTAKELQAMAEGIYGGTLASGTIPRDELYDAAELGVNLLLRSFPSRGGHGMFSPAVDEANGATRAAQIAALKDRLPTQTVRAGEKETHQQFSTPTDYAYAGAWAANLHPSDVVLEPSAGTGSFVTHALNAGVREVHANDLSDRRADMLRALEPTNVTKENAEHIDALLPESLKPTVILMNPPFSQTAGRMGTRRVLGVDFQHVKAALRKLAPGGRLVAILGGGAKPENHGWRSIRQEYDLRANIGVEGGIYRKYGTTFPTRLVVIDKRAPSGARALEVEGLKSAQDIIRALKDVRDDRLHLAGEQPSPEPAGETLAGRGESAIEPGAPVPEPAGAMGGREGRPSAQPGGTAGPRAAGERPARDTGKRGQGAGSRVPVAGEQPQRPEPRGAGEHPGTGTAASEEPAGSGGGGAGDGVRPDGSGQRTEPGVTEAPAVVRATEASLAADPETAPISDAVYEPYKPQRVAVEGAKPHPGPLVQSAAMASVLPPKPEHALSIPKRIIEQGALSDAQIEAVVYAGYAHAKMLPESGIRDTPGHLPERRRGFFIGDGTGVGKGREVAGIMLDNWHAGRRQHIWVSEKRPLINDAMRDLKGVTLDPKHIIDHGAVKAGDSIKKKEGVLFTTYDTLKSAEQIKKEITDESGKKVLAKAKGKTRVQQIIDWVGDDFDGVIAFDEAHNLGNSFDMKGNRGMKKAAAKALAGVELAKRLPKARVVYVSATGATEVENLGYADRLGLWGKDTAFAGRDDFMAKVKKGGVAAMELVARDMKALGRYIARSLSYDGVEYDRVEHTLTPQQREIYDNLADAWQLVLRNFNAAMEKAGITERAEDGSSRTKSAQAKSAILAQFWGGNQRFFNQVLTAMQMPTVLRRVEKDLAEGRQAVLQLVNTNEAAQTRALDKVRAEGDESDLEDLDMSPKSQLLQLVSNAYPVNRFEEYMDENGNVRSRPAMDSKGNVIQDPALVDAREALLDQLGAIRVPDGPLEMLLNHFGTEKVAEVTGRKERVVRKPDEQTGEMRTVVEKRPGSSNVVEADLFQEAKKPILVFSEAGGTGRSYHADVNAASADKRRSHYLVQAGWRADKAVQGFGRTHRTNQASAPIFHLVTTDLQGQKRFVSSIARRLGQLGALTKGERRTGNQGMFGLRDNLESEEAKLALKTFYSDALADRIPGVGLQMLEEQMGLKLVEDATGRPIEELPPITQFLNRVLSLRTDMQNRVFDEFSKRLDDAIDRAAASGTLDTGVETRRADKIIKLGDQVVYTDPESGAETRHIHLETHDKVNPAKFADVVTRLRKHNADGVTPFVRSVKSGKVFGVQDSTPYTDKNGAIIEQKRLVGPLSYEFIPTGNLNNDRFWQPIDKPDQQAAAWEAQLAKLPEYAKADLHLITGAVLPIWDRLQGNPRIFRLQTDAGEKMLGRVIPNDSVADTLKALGAEALKVRESPAEIATSILEDGKRATLANGWEIKRSMVAGEPRIEIVGPDHQFLNELKGEGVFTERIDWQTRFFIPTGERAGDIIAAITKKRPVTQLAGKAQASQHQRMEEEPARPFFSALTRAIEGVNLKRAPAKDWLGLIANLSQKGVKQEEIDWSGVKDWLGGQTQPVTKEAVLEHLRENEVKVQEVEKGANDALEPKNDEWERIWDWIQNKSGLSDEQRIIALRTLDALVEGSVHALGALEETGVPNELIGPYREWLGSKGGATKFGVHVLPGGEKYRELLLTLPPIQERMPAKAPPGWGGGPNEDESYTTQYIDDGAGGVVAHRRRTADFHGGHWEEPNVLAHVRFDDRKGPKGEKVLHIAEIQSDWHQRGRKVGYDGRQGRSVAAIDKDLDAVVAELSARGERRASTQEEFTALWERNPDLLARHRTLMAERHDARSGGAVPSAPFKTSWHELAMKRMLRYAAEHGYDKITWDTGDTNADRYQRALAENVKHIAWEKNDDGTFDIDAPKPDGSPGVHKQNIPAKDLSDLVGKDIADKIVKGEGRKDEASPLRDWRILEGEQLKIGGHGMRAFYDRILPQFLARYGRRFGTKPERVPEKKSVELGAAHHAGTTEEKLRAMGQHARDVLVAKYKKSEAYADEVGRHSIDVTPAMRESVMRGQPLFRREPVASGPRAGLSRLAHDVVAELPHAPSPEERAVIDRVTKLAKALAPKAEVVAARNLYAEGVLGQRREHGISGVTTRGARRLIAWSLASPDAIATMRHEAIHWLRANGFFKPAEWAQIEKAARTGDWIGRYNIRERYSDLPFESQLEEAIAEHFAYWRRALRGTPEAVRPFFERLAKVLGQVRDYLRQAFGHDTTLENIFHRIESGEIGARTADSMRTPVPVFGKRAGLQEMDASLFQKMEPEERDNRIVEAARALVNVAEDFQMLTAPMARGTDTARATVKDFLNLIRAGRDYGQLRIKQLGKEFSHDELKRMWEAADAESILRQKGVTDTAGRGLSTLSERERAAVDRDQADADSVWNAMIKAGQVKAEGLPSYVPHLYVEVGETGYRRLGGNRNVRSIPGMGQNVRTSSPHMKHRKYLTAEEGAEAASKKFGVQTAVLKDIRTLPLATSRNRQALAGFQLIKTIREMGRAVGEDWVAEGATPPGFFHIDNPAFFRWQPKLVRNEMNGKLEPATDQNGNKLWERIPLSVHEAWEGPLRAGLTHESSAAYRAFMDLKMRAMTNIMFSPFVQLHFMTELGRAFPAAPGKILTTKLFMEGFQAKQDPATRLRAVMAGLVPVGRHGALQDISSVTETQSLVPGRSWTSQILAAVPGLFDPRAGEAVKRGVDGIGNLLHGTLLWDRVEDLQFGLFLTLSDWARGKGLSPESADRLAAHQANRFAGTLPQESMSSFARKLSNIMLFSRTYTLGNLGMFKDALGSFFGAGVNLVGRGIGRPDIGKSWGGLPRDVQAQIGRDAPEELARVQSLAKRKSLSMLAIDVALIYGLSALAQNFFQYMQGEDADEIVKGYAARWTKLEADIRKDPFLIVNPFYALMHLSPLWENELDPDTGMPLQRIFIGYDKEGTAIYARNPLGKYAEEIGNWTTAPLVTLKIKLNALAVKPTMDVLHNDRGFNRKIWLPSDNIAQIMGKIAAHYAEAAVPMNQIQASYDMLTGHTRSLDAARLAGGALGMTFRHGAPGGPAVGLMYQVRDVHEARVRDAMPGIMQQIKEGDLQGARVKMNALHIPPRLQSWYIRVGRNPRLRLSGRALRDFMREATPEQRAQMERMRGANQ